jgi:TonB-linked SusC/RagA family outer membrane protein
MFMSNSLLKSKMLLLLVLLFYSSTTLFAQEIASVSRPELDWAYSKNEQYKPLKKALTELELYYNVRFNFASHLVEHKIVSSDTRFSDYTNKVSKEENLEKDLSMLLKPFGLIYKKVGTNIYGIYSPKDRSANDTKKSEALLGNMKLFGPSLAGLKNLVIPIKGKIKSDVGDALPGVSILVKGTTNGTVTDNEGNFTLEVPDANGTLIISYIGYVNQEIALNGRTIIDVVMETEIEQLGEVVVTALGIKKESKKLGYATATVKPEQITENRTTNFMNALQGKMAGVNISSLGTGPAGTSKIRIRGQSSFGGQNTPLIVINGVPVDNTNYGVNPNAGSDGSIGNRSYNNSDGGDGLSSINPDDIESMTVLKGAPAAALYGSRAKDGVIMITTKSKGSNKGFGVEWNSNFVTDTPLDYTDYQYEYGQGENGVRPTSANPTSGVWSFGEKFQPGMTQVLFDGVEVPYTPQKNHIKDFYRTGNTWTNTISLSNGGDKGGFNLSLSNTDNKSIVPNSNYNRKTINLGFTQTVIKKLTISGNMNYSNEYNHNPPQIANQDLATSTVVYTLANSMPMSLLKEKMVDPNGNEYIWTRFRNRTNPYFSAYQRFEKITRDRIFGNITAKYNFTNWLYLQARIGQDYYSRDQAYNYPTGTALRTGSAQPGFVDGEYTQETRRFREINTDFLIGATKKFGRFGIDLTAGGNQRYTRGDLNSVFVNEFVIRGLYSQRNGRVKDPLYTLYEKKVNSLYAAAELSYNDFLFLNVTGRNDWFSVLSIDDNNVFYPSVTGSFVFTQAIPNVPSWLSFGKLRAGYAEVGDAPIDPYQNRLYYEVNNNFFPGPTGALQPVGIVSSNTVPNKKLRPMRVKESEVGVELKFFNSRLGIDFSYYSKISYDQILRAQISDASGYLDRYVNIGKGKNQGVELLLTASPVKTNSLQWDITFNYAYNTSKVLKLGANPSDTMISVGRGIFEGELRQWVGHPIGQLFAYGYLHDSQGRQVFDATSGRPVRTATPQPYGSAIPKYIGGILNSITYKGISLSVLIDFKLGHKMISATNFNAWREGLHKETLPGREEGYMIGNGVKTNGEPNDIKTPVQSYYETVRSQNILGQFVYDAGYWKLRQITLGYDFTKLLPSNFFVKGIRLSAVANNVAILKKWVPNIDPESFGYSSDNVVGLESTGIPTTRSIGFNLNAKF